MSAEPLLPVFPSPLHHSAAIAVRRFTFRKWVLRAGFSGIAMSVCFYGLMWWTTHLSPEEQTYLGCWVSADSFVVSSPNVSVSGTCLREMEFMQGQAIRLKYWQHGTAYKGTGNALMSASSSLYPLRIRSVIPVAMTPLSPTQLSVIHSSPPTGQINGRWKITEGKLQIEWDSSTSQWSRIRQLMADKLFRIQTISLSSQEAQGTLSRNSQDQMTLLWIGKSSAVTGGISPPQVWWRVSD